MRPTLAGELIGSLAVTEPDGGSDVAGIRTTARRDGDHYVVNGTKTFITSGVRADFVTTAVRTGGPGPRRDLAAGRREGHARLHASTASLAKMGWHCSDTAELSYVDVRVPVANLVGEENAGFYQIAAQFVVERIALAVHGYGIAGRAARAHRGSTAATARPSASRSSPTRWCATSWSRCGGRWRWPAPTPARSPAGTTAGEDVIAEACLAKQTAVEAAVRVCDEAVQLHGGTGYLHGTEVERHYRDARILPIGGGATEVLTDLAARAAGYAS